MSRTSRIDLNILFERPFIKILEKPVKTHFDEIIPYKSDTWKEWSPAHRLDFETSGCLVFTREVDGEKFRKGLNDSQKVRKYYLAGLQNVLLDFEDPLKETLFLEGFIASRYKSSKKVQYFSFDHPPNPRFWKSMQPVGMKVFRIRDRKKFDPQNVFSGHLYLVQLQTGARHQIRATLSHLGSSIVGDPLYGSATEKVKDSTQRMELHAWKIEIDESLFGEEISVVCPLQSKNRDDIA